MTMAVMLALLASPGATDAREITGQKEAPAPDDGPVKMKIGLVFPMETRDGVPVLTAAVLINDRTVLPAGTRLYTLYRMPEGKDEDMKQAQKKVERAQAYSRARGVADQPRRSAASIALEQRAFKTRWDSDLPFRAMLNLYGANDLFFVIAGAGGTPEIHPLNLPEGLLLWDRGQGIEVGWVTDESPSSRAGFRRGDRVLSISGKPTGNLAEFQKEYGASKTGGRDANLAIDVKPASGDAPVTRQLQAPATLKGSFLEMPIE